VRARPRDTDGTGQAARRPVWDLPEHHDEIGDLFEDDKAFEEALQNRRRELFAALEQLN
jgi:hypothetical protein